MKIFSQNIINDYHDVVSV